MYTQPLTPTLTSILTLTLIPTLIPITVALAEEQEWAIKVRKYSSKIHLGETTKNKLAEFVKMKIYIYKKEDFLDNTCREIFIPYITCIEHVIYARRVYVSTLY